MAGDLIGREAELATTSALLEGRVRLLTLTGPPGVGKTRLATELATRLVRQFRDGVMVVDLSSAVDRSGALDQVSRCVGVGGPGKDDLATRLHRWFRDKQMLVLLDNAEQVEDVAVELSALMKAAPHVQLLVTSRENMHLSQEHEFSVPPLAMPSATELHDLDAMRQVPSVALFVAAARAVRPDFDVSAENAPAVAEICRRVDGLPLALTLAAPRVKLFSPADIAARLRDRKAILEASAKDVPARHRSLWAAISWSHAVLTPAEQTLFRRLSVFAAPWTLREAELVCGEPGLDVVETLSSLLDKSLVQPVLLDSPEAHFALLQSIREFGADQLRQSNDRAAVEATHTELFVDAARRSEAAIGTNEEQDMREWATRREADVRAALDRALEADDLDSVLRLTAITGWACYTHGHLGAGRDLVEDVLARAETSTPPPDASAMLALRVIGGVLAWAVGDLDRAETLLDAALAASHEHDDPRHRAMTLAFLGHVARDRGDYLAATASHETAREVYDGLGNEWGAAWARFDLGRVAWQRGDLGAAADLLADALARFRRLDYTWALAWTTWALGSVLAASGDSEDGPALLASALTEFERVEDVRGAVLCWESLAVLAAAGARAFDAVRLIGAATAARDELAAPRTGAELARVEDALAVARATLGDYRFDREARDGATVPLRAAYDLAHDLAAGYAPAGAVQVPGPGWASLTGREQEVAALVVEGCTNQQVGRRLGITARTAEAHVRNIMVKLGVRSRAEVAVWAVTQGSGAGPATPPYVVSPMAPAVGGRVDPKGP
jgi:non-specific serine/threonine protein kinase